MNAAEYNTCVEKYLKMVYRISFHYFGNREDAEDVSQDVFIKLYSSKISTKNDEEIKAWLIRVTTNTCHSYFRNPFRRKRIDIDENEIADIVDTGSSEQDIVNRKVVMDGSDQVEIKNYNGISFEKEGKSYSMFAWDCDMTADEWYEMAEELLAK